MIPSVHFRVIQCVQSNVKQILKRLVMMVVGHINAHLIDQAYIKHDLILTIEKGNGKQIKYRVLSLGQKNWKKG